eukprot:3912883-Alexandrium_andersonii.AAC.1
MHAPKTAQQERIIHQSVEVPIVANVHIPKTIPQERIIQQAVEQVVKAPIPMTQEEVVHEPTVGNHHRHHHVEVEQTIPQECIIQQAVEQE